MRVLIVGGGRVGQHLAAALAGSGHVVAVVDRDADVCGQVQRLAIEAICGDACTMECLEAAQIRRRDVLVAVTGVDENNLVAAFLARREYNVPRIIARVNDPANAYLYTPDCGVDVAVSQAHLLSTIVQEELSLGAMVTLASLRGGKVAVVEERLPPRSGLVGRTLATVSLPPHTAIVAVLRGGVLLPSEPNLTFQDGDEIVAVADVGAEPALAALIGSQAGD
jgi:trk system potassium uptake protein TrkA